MSTTQTHATDREKHAANIGVALHRKAAECCEHAAEEHRRAAECCARGENEKAIAHAKNAQDQCKQAQEHGRQAAPH